MDENLQTTNSVPYMDYHGIWIRSDTTHLYHPCTICGEYDWHQALIFGMCIECLFQLPYFWLVMSFGVSKSKTYEYAVKLAKKFPTYINFEDRHVVRFGNLIEFYNSRHMAMRLVDTIMKWVSFRVALNCRPITSKNIFYVNEKIDQIDAMYSNKLTSAEKMEQFILYQCKHVRFSNADVIDIYNDDQLTRAIRLN